MQIIRVKPANKFKAESNLSIRIAIQVVVQDTKHFARNKIRSPALLTMDSLSVLFEVMFHACNAKRKYSYEY